MAGRKPFFSAPEQPPVDCPRCGTRAVRAGTKPYCRSCGWNVSAAEQYFRSFLRPPRWHFLVGIVALAVMGLEYTWIVAAFYVVFFLVMQASMYWWARRQLRKFQAELPQESEIRQKDPPVPESYRVLQTVPRPRQVRLTKEGRRRLLTYFVVLLQAAPLAFFALRIVSDLRGTRGTLRLLFLLHIVAGYAVALWQAVHEIWREVRNRGLLVDGEIALGKVVSQEGATFLWVSASNLAYEFRDGANRTVQGKDTDLTGKLFEEMLVPVLYDPQNPARNVAIPCTHFEVLMPRGLETPVPAAIRPEMPGSNWLESIRGWINGGRGGSSA